MSFNIVMTPLFEGDLKKLAKRHSSVKGDVSDLIRSLEKNPLQGQPLGNNCFKIRMAISSKKKGKSGGARVISYVKLIDEDVYLLSIYDKADVETITDAEILERLGGL